MTVAVTHPPFSDQQRARTMALSLLEAAFYAVMVGAGEGYFLADAVRLGATAVELGLVTSLPLFVGGLGPLPALALAARSGRRKPLVVGCAAVQAAALAALAVGDAVGWLNPTSLIVIACLHQACAQTGGTAWSSWIGAVVPAEARGRYFARRSRRVQVGTMAALLGAGLVLQQLEPAAAGRAVGGAGGFGFVVAFGVAALARAVSAALLAASPEPAPEGEARAMPLRGLLRSPEASPARRVLAVGAALQLAVYLSSPYFGPYMLEELHMSYAAYTVGSLAVVATKVASLPSWGKVVDSYNPRSVFLLAAFLVSVIPLPWLWADGLLWVVVAQVLSGFAWGGHEIAQMALYLDITKGQMRQQLFAAQSLLHGAAQLAATVIGGWMLGLAGRRFWVLFLISTVARLIVALLAPRWLAHVDLPGERRHVLLLRVMGLRPSGGLMHRPLAVDDLTPAPQPQPQKKP